MSAFDAREAALAHLSLSASTTQALLWGGLLGIGLLGIAAPLLWPRRQRMIRSGISAGLLLRIDDRLRQAGFDGVSAVTFLVVSAVLGGILAAAGFLAFGMPTIALLTGAFSACIPWLVVSGRARARRIRHRGLWPDLVDHLVAAVRAGMPLPEALAGLEQLGPEHTRARFADFAARMRRSGHFASALSELKAELADPVADRILETLRMAREVGGTELTQVLQSLAEYLRQDLAIRSELEARQSWLMNAARLGVAAPWATLLILCTRPEAAAAYNSAAGSLVIMVTVVLTLVAYRVMLMLGRLPEERRWFR